MAERGVGAAVVLDPEAMGPGIITERDVLHLARPRARTRTPSASPTTSRPSSSSPRPTGRSSRPPSRWSAAASATSSSSTRARSPASSRCATSCAAGPTTARAASCPQQPRAGGARVVAALARAARSVAGVMVERELVDLARARRGSSDHGRDDEQHERRRSRRIGEIVMPTIASVRPTALRTGSMLGAGQVDLLAGGRGVAGCRRASAITACRSARRPTSSRT